MSLAVLLATFMSGTCLGSLLLPPMAPQKTHPVRVYAVIELGIGSLGILELLVTPLVGQMYTAWGGYGLAGFFLRGAVAAGCLLPPTLLMGATLPILARCVDSAENSASRLGFLYSANVSGAVFGSLLAGFYLLRQFDVMTATFVAAAINAVVAAAATSMPLLPRGEAVAQNVADPKRKGISAIYFAIALSGFCAMASEALWTRSLGLLFGASVYTLSIIVAVFLTGLVLGSGVASLIAQNPARAKVAFGWSQLLAACGIAWTSYSLNASLPYWPIDPSISTSIWFNFELDLDRALWALLPPTVLWGASFTLALSAASIKKTDAGKLMAGVYASNTAGAILGAVASLFLIVAAGSQHAQQLLIALSAFAGLLVLMSENRADRIVMAAAVVVAAAFLIRAVPPISKLLVAHGRYASTWSGKGEIIYAAEGMNSSVAVSDFANATRTFHVAGKIQASNVPRDMRLQRMLGHLSSLTASHPRSVLVIGCGAGITAGAVSVDPEVERETIVEIEPLVPAAASEYFAKQNFDVIHNRKVQVRIDDGRHYLLTTKERFDAITADPLDPWVKGAANLYTREFFNAVREHLGPGGVVTVYIQLFETNSDAVKSALATFFEVFPNGTVWGNTYEGRGHDMVLLGQAEPMHIDLNEMEQRIHGPGYVRVMQSLDEIGMHSALDLFSTYAGRGSDLTQWLRGAAINRDRNLRMQYLAGFGLNLDDSAAIYAEMMRYRRIPGDIFRGTPEQMDALRNRIQADPR